MTEKCAKCDLSRDEHDDPTEFVARELPPSKEQVRRFYRGTDGMQPNIAGDWVLYSDYERLQRRHDDWVGIAQTANDNFQKLLKAQSSAHEPPADPVASFKDFQKRSRAWAQSKIDEQTNFTKAHELALVIGYQAGWSERATPPPGVLPDPNEGPIGGHGFVEVSDGVLPAFLNHWSCSQCGRRPEYVRENGCPESCGRTALTKAGE